MSGLIRAVRLQVLRQNLQLVIQLRETMVERQLALGELLDRPKDWAQQLRDLRWGALRKLEDALNPVAGEPDWTAAEDARVVILDAVTRLGYEFSNGVQDARDLALRYFRLPESRDAGYKDVFTFLDLADELAKNLTEDSLVLDSRRCDDLFAEYVELLRGIALRDSGVRVHGRELVDVFRIADSLPALWGRAEGWGWRSVTVPSRVEGQTPGASNALRIGFPEWTVWALPLVQTELGYSFLTKAKAFTTTASAEDVVCAADAAATLVTGPAYALPALLLRLRPEDAADPSSFTGRRAATIIAALRVAGDADDSLGVRGVAEALATEWASAVVEAGADEAEVASRPEKAEGLVTQVLTAMARATTIAGEQEPTALVWAREWGVVLEWAKAMRDAVPATVAPDPGARLQLDLDVAARPRPDERPLALPLLLSAAWLVRSGLDGQPPVDAGWIEPLAAAVVDQCLLALPTPEGSAPRQPSSRLGSNR